MTEKNYINVAIDGPAGAGKSTIAKKTAADLGFIYVDTGALYRSIALYKIKNNITDDKLISSLDKINIELKYISGTQHVILNGEDVSCEIRTPDVSMASSCVSKIPQVREFLLDLQRTIARNNNIIMDGRDIGTVVLPDADLKIFITAAAQKRAERRWSELSEKKDCPSFESVLEDIKQRDYNDTHRDTAPLKKADDAVVLDTSDMTLEESCEAVRKLIKAI